MQTVRKIIIRTFILLIILYVLICTALYFFQEKLIFFPCKLDNDYQFSFETPFEELNIKTHGDDELNGLLFTVDSAKGLVFFLHGNAGALDSWGEVAKRYTDLRYDVFIVDYPGYGKSSGSIKNEKQFYQSVQVAYDEMRKRYKEDKIAVLGYSIGSGPAAWLASNNHPRLLILHAPYYSLIDIMRRAYPIVPTFLLKYKFATYKYIKDCRMPVILFHGDRDEVINYDSALKLKAELKPGDTLITLKSQGHNGITDNRDYIEAIKAILK